MASRFRAFSSPRVHDELCTSWDCFASAAAGFAPGSLWLSKTEAKAGETLKIFTVVYDSGLSPIEGDVVFTVDAKNAGTRHFKLNAGNADSFF